MNRYIYRIIVSLIILLIGVQSCEPIKLPGENLPLLNIDQVGVTEVWLRLKSFQMWHRFGDAGFIADRIQVKRDGVIVFSLRSTSIDTIITDKQLEPNHRYTYKAYQLIGNDPVDSSDARSITTMDTTNHKINWYINTFGDVYSNFFTDVSILNDSCAYAVGTINVIDSLGDDYPPHGVAFWDGKNWILRTIYFKGLQTSGLLLPRGVFCFSKNNVWFAAGSVFEWDGINDTAIIHPIINVPGNPYAILKPGQSAEKLWGTSSKDIYVVGRKGAIAHYDGTTWQAIESGTTSDINDIWGVKNTRTGSFDILCAVSNIYDTGEWKLLRINPDRTVDSLSWCQNGSLSTVWFKSMNKIFIGGGGVHVGVPGSWEKVTSIPSYYSQNVRGTDLNNIFIVGHYGLLLHYNGITWKYYNTGINEGILHSVSVNGHLNIIVGEIESGRKGLIIMGYRN